MKNEFYSVSRIALTCALGGLVPTIAHAEEAADSGDNNILVIGQRAADLNAAQSTGSRLGLTVLETPASIYVVDGDVLRARGDISVQDAVSRATGIANVSSPGDGNTGLAARGFSGQGSVLRLVNGVRLFPVAGTITFPADPWNVDRIEVLSGPASVLYGQGALGGAVNVITKAPNRVRSELAGEAGYGSQDTWHVAGGAGGPLGDMFAYRVDASYRHSNGYVKRGESESLALSGAIGFYPSDDFSLVLRNDYGNVEPQRYEGTPLVNGGLDTSIRKENYNVDDAIIRFRDNQTLLTLDWSPSEAITISNTAYLLTTDRRWRNAESYCWVGPDGDCPSGYGGGTPGRVYRADYLGIRHEQRQIGNVGSITIKTPLGGSMHNQLVVGFDYNQIRLTYSHDFPADAPFVEDEVDLIDPTPGLYQGVPTIPRRRHSTTEYSLFAEDRLEFSERFSIVGGVRFERDKVQRFNIAFNPDGSRTETNAFASIGETARIFKNTTWRVGAVYQPTSAISIYGQYSTGVDPLGTLVTLSAGEFPRSNPTGYQIEAGIKASFLDGRGSATLAAYKIVKKDLLAQLAPNGPVQQVGQRSSKGIEASLSVALGSGFAIDANGTVLDARYDNFISGDTDFSGKTPGGVPETLANLWLTWDAFDRFQARAGLRYVGRIFFDESNQSELPSYTVVDAGLSYALSDQVAVDLRVYNLFDKAYATAYQYHDEQWFLGRPRSFDVALRARF